MQTSPRLHVSRLQAGWGAGGASGVDGFGPGRAVEFAVDASKWLGVVGANGVGKSTLLHALAGTADTTSGDVFVDGTLMRQGDSEARFLGGVALVPQHPSVVCKESWHTALRDAIGLALGNRPGLRNEIALEDLFDRLEKMKWLARNGAVVPRLFDLVCAIIAIPRVLILDEVLGAFPTEMRTVDRYRELRTLLPGTSVVFTDHDVDRVLDAADSILWLRTGMVPVHFRTSGDGNLRNSDLVRALREAHSVGRSAGAKAHPGACAPDELIRLDRYVTEERRLAELASGERAREVEATIRRFVDGHGFLWESGREVRALSGGQRLMLGALLARVIDVPIVADASEHLDPPHRRTLKDLGIDVESRDEC